VVYAADHPALALLEVRVHLDLPPGLLPADYVMMRLARPDPAESLPTVPEDPRATGDAWLAAARGAVLRVPSVLVPSAANLLLNPTHPGAAAARIEAVEPFAFDPRLWLGAGGP
jgi:RES domain-containing protein